MNFTINVLNKLSPKSLNPFGSIIDFIAQAKLAALIIGIVFLGILIALTVLVIKKIKKNK